MSRHLRRNLEDLNKLLLTMGGLVEDTLLQSSEALHRRDRKLAKKVIAKDDEIDNLEIRIDEECLKLLALHQPFAEDLRFITAVMKINNDLERMADLAVNVAERAISLSKSPPITIPSEFEKMVKTISSMIRDVLKAFLERNSIAARTLVHRDDEVDDYHKKFFADQVVFMKEHPEKADLSIQLLWVSRNLERIADHATNIAEDVVYMVEGEIIRHRNWWNLEIESESVMAPSTKDTPQPTDH